MKVFLKNRAFTLIEIVVVIAIMGVLTVIIYSSFDASKAQSRDQKRVSDISAIQIALEQFFQKNASYPLTLDKLVTNGFISEIPKDPSSNIDYSGNYIPITKTFDTSLDKGSDKCVSYQLWTKFEMNNSYLGSKRSFNSLFSLSTDNNPGNKTTLYECGGDGTHPNAKINASPAGSLIYDVMP